MIYGIEASELAAHNGLAPDAGLLLGGRSSFPCRPIERSPNASSHEARPPASGTLSDSLRLLNAPAARTRLPGLYPRLKLF